MTKYIGITGLKGHGKDTLARMVREYEPQWHNAAFASPLKTMVQRLFGLTEYDVYDEQGKEAELPQPIFMDDHLTRMRYATGLQIESRGLTALRPRDLLQLFGTEYVKSIQSDYWMKLLDQETADSDFVCITDLRFPDEEEWLNTKGAFIVRVTRLDLPQGVDSHSSESYIPKIQPDLEVFTRTGKFSLMESVARELAFCNFDVAALYNMKLMPAMADALAEMVPYYQEDQ
jgi:hypothetical protein|tara:strand:+ start:218542 stop:219234 length:693 start_codon:yes stop_codon:yes gene_type:complete